MPTFRHMATLGQPSLTLPSCPALRGQSPRQGPPCWNAFSSCSSLVFPAQNPFPSLCLSREVKQWLLVSRLSVETVPSVRAGVSSPAPEASLPLILLNSNFLYYPSSLLA